MSSDLSKVKFGRRSFIPAKLPKYEIIFYFVVWIAHSLAALIIAWKVSYRLRPMLYHWTSRSDYIKGYYADNSDPEWSLYRLSVRRTVITYLLHSCIYSLIKRFPVTYQRHLTPLLWVVMAVYLTSVPCVAIYTLLSVVVIGIVIYLRKEIVAWLICILFVLKADRYAYYSPIAAVYYAEYNFYLYGAIKIINFCVFLSRNPNQTVNKDVLLRCAQYLFYPPYTSMLIVLFDDFNDHMNKVEKADTSTKENRRSELTLLFRFIRLVLWFFIFEFLLHFIYVNFIFESDVAIFNTLGPYESASVAYIRGQLFHLKYVVIFGIPAFFASLDGLNPPGPPVCISRISRYSSMWRCFDKGLYQFLKHQVYVPLGGSKNSANFQLRRFLAMISAFLFVLAWHGTGSAYVSWVALSFVELCIEHIGQAINKTELWWKLSYQIGLQNQRRIVAALMNATVIPGIFGVFFFLGRQGAGAALFKHMLVKGWTEFLQLNITLNPVVSKGFVFLHLILLGYCFNNVCLELDERLYPQAVEKQKNE